MSQSTHDMLYDQLISTRESLEDIWLRIDHDQKDAYEQAVYELDSRPLEIVWEIGEPFAVVLGTGGPHIEIRGGSRHDGASYTLHGYWGGEHVTVSGPAITRTGEYFRELKEDETLSALL